MALKERNFTEKPIKCEINIESQNAMKKDLYLRALRIEMMLRQSEPTHTNCLFFFGIEKDSRMVKAKKTHINASYQYH